MNEQNKMCTTLLEYDVIGKECPRGMVAKNCKFREKLAELQKQHKIGYKILENGNLLVPRWAMLGQEWENKNFRLEDVISDCCNRCYAENRKKEMENPEEHEKYTWNDTIIFAYVLNRVNCPVGMDEKNCPLRKTMIQTEQEHHVGYKEISKDTLLVPSEHYNSKTNVYNDISKRCAEICSKCFEKNR